MNNSNAIFPTEEMQSQTRSPLTKHKGSIDSA